MKCPNCNSEITLKIASKSLIKGAKILTSMTTVLTVQCGACNKVFQVPVQSNSFFSVKEDR